MLFHLREADGLMCLLGPFYRVEGDDQLDGLVEGRGVLERNFTGRVWPQCALELSQDCREVHGLLVDGLNCGDSPLEALEEFVQTSFRFHSSVAEVEQVGATGQGLGPCHTVEEQGPYDVVHRVTSDARLEGESLEARLGKNYLFLIGGSRSTFKVVLQL